MEIWTELVCIVLIVSKLWRRIVIKIYMWKICRNVEILSIMITPKSIDTISGLSRINWKRKKINRKLSKESDANIPMHLSIWQVRSWTYGSRNIMINFWKPFWLTLWWFLKKNNLPLIAISTLINCLRNQIYPLERNQFSKEMLKFLWRFRLESATRVRHLRVKSKKKKEKKAKR